MNKVRATYFLARCPGLPIYDMANGEIRMPCWNTAVKQHFWLTLAEITAQADPVKNKEFIEQHTKNYNEAVKEIEKIRLSLV